MIFLPLLLVRYTVVCTSVRYRYVTRGVAVVAAAAPGGVEGLARRCEVRVAVLTERRGEWPTGASSAPPRHLATVAMATLASADPHTGSNTRLITALLLVLMLACPAPVRTHSVTHQSICYLALNLYSLGRRKLECDFSSRT